MSVVLRNAAECAAQRAFLHGGEAVALEKDGHAEQAATARRRYWRELASSEALLGRPWAEADALGEVRNG